MPNVNNIGGLQDLIDDSLDHLTQEQITGLLDNPVYRAWILEELKERAEHRKVKAELD